jgi:beta-lactamase regulating signal transducer with metallopeptidase domain
MASEALHYLLKSSGFICVSLVLIFSLRIAIRQWFGAALAYQLWGLIPVIAIASAFPNPPEKAQIVVATQKVTNWASNAHFSVPTESVFTPELWIVLWAIGATILATYFLLQHRYYLKKLGKLTKNHPLFYTTLTGGSPALIGIWHTQIIVPADFSQRYSTNEQQLVIAHEQCHAKRKDPLFNLLCTILQVIFWFNPLMYLAEKYFRIDQELACDAKVIEIFPHAQREYAEALLKTQVNNLQTHLACQLNSYALLKERIIQINKNTQRKLPFGKLFIFVLIFGSGISTWATTPAVVEVAVKNSTTGTSDTVYNLAYKLQLSWHEGDIQHNSTYEVVVQSKGNDEVHTYMNEPNAKWDISYTVNPAPNESQTPRAVMIAFKIKRDDELLASPSVLATLDIVAAIETQLKNTTFKAEFTPHLALIK